MRPTLYCLVLLAALAGCQRQAPRPLRSEPLPEPRLTKSIELPNGDGRVYVIDAPDRIGVERSTCMVHASDRGSSIACTGSRLDPG